jgi:hypothetical protein
MLTAADASANTGAASHDLRDEAQKITAISKKMAMVSVVRQDDIGGVVKRPHHRHGAEFLSNARMGGPGEKPL